MPVADRIDLTNVDGSMTNIIHNNADKLYAAQSVRELHDILLSIFRENNLDTNASRRLLSRVIEQRNIKQGLNAIFNSYFKGANMGRDKEKVGGKPKMFKIDEKLKKIVSEDIEKIEVETTAEEITVETDGDAVKVEIEPKTAECADCEISDESSVDLDDYAFFSDLNPETDIDDIEINIDDSVDSNTEDNDKVEESKSIKESNDINPDIWKAIGRHFDYIIAEKAAEILENLADRALMQDNVEDTYEAVIRAIDDGLFNTADIWEINALYDECELSDNAYSCLIDDLVAIVDAVRTGDLNEGIEKKYVKPIKDKINACHTKQDLDEIGAYLDDFSDKDIDRILSGKVSNKDLNKMFGGYNFVDDDFPGWDFKEYKVVKESVDPYDQYVEDGLADGWIEEDDGLYGYRRDFDNGSPVYINDHNTHKTLEELIDSGVITEKDIKEYLCDSCGANWVEIPDNHMWIYFNNLEDLKYYLKLDDDCKLFNNIDEYVDIPETIYESKSIKESGTNNTEIRCANAQYEDDDGYICNVGIYAADLDFEELTDILYDAGMLYVDVYDEYTSLYPSTYVSNLKPGDVVDVFDTDDDVINTFCANNDLDPEDYKHIGFFESKKN